MVLGGDPAYRLMAGSSLATALSPLMLGGLLRGQPIELVKCRTIDFGVPADADLVLEGHVEPSADCVDAGPVGGASGFYSVPQRSPVMHVAAITERTSPICPATIPGQSTGESAALAHAAERIFLPLVQAVVPELVDYALPDWGGPERFVMLAIRKTYPQQARRVAAAIWGWEPLMTAKMIVIVDGDVDVHDLRQVWSRVGAHVASGPRCVLPQRPGRLRPIMPLRSPAPAMRWRSTPRQNCPTSIPALGPPRPKCPTPSANSSAAAGVNTASLRCRRGGYEPPRCAVKLTRKRSIIRRFRRLTQIWICDATQPRISPIPRISPKR